MKEIKDAFTALSFKPVSVNNNLHYYFLPFFILDCDLLTEKLRILNPRVAIKVDQSTNNHSFNPILMDIRSDVFNQILDYRRKCFQFPTSKEIQFAFVLKFYVIELRRRIWPIETKKYIKNHLAAIMVFERLFSAHLLSMNTDFAQIEGWDIHSQPKSQKYCFADDFLNNIINKS